MLPKTEQERKRKAIEKLNSEMIKSEIKYLIGMTLLGILSIVTFLVFAPSLGMWIDSWPWYYQAGIAIASFLLVFLWIRKQNR
jgi:uncharacterized membrane protein